MAEPNTEEIVLNKKKILNMLHRVIVEHGDKSREKPVLFRLNNGMWQFVCTMAHLGHIGNLEYVKICNKKIELLEREIRKKMKK